MLVKSQVKYIQSLGQKKFRDQEGVFIAEGPKMVRELLKASNVQLLHLFALVSFREEGEEKKRISPAREGIPLERREDIPFTEVTEGELERLSYLSTPNQVLAVFKKPVFPHPDADQGVSLVLDGIQDPGNLGTIVRIADWFGIRQVVCTRDSADVFSPKAAQSTMGSISRVQVSYEDPEAIMDRHPALPVYAAVLDGKSIYEAQPITRGWVIIGNESKGIREELLKRSTHPITIPRLGQAESLNAAVATGIILSHLVR